MGLASIAVVADSPCEQSRRTSCRRLDHGTAMSSPHRRAGDSVLSDVAFWLPPGGQNNGVCADRWAEIADLKRGDVELVLAALAACGVAGYVAIPGGLRLRLGRSLRYRLWVDSMKYHQAEDVLMKHFSSAGDLQPKAP